MARIVIPSMFALARRYLSHRRNFGYALTEKPLLFDFARFVDRVAPRRPITTALALEWISTRTLQRVTQVRRLSLIRGFAKFCAALDPRTQVPDTHLLGPICRRTRPHIYTAQQIQLILERTRGLPTRHSPLHPLTFETFIGLLACTGLRSGEARRLRAEDFNADTGSLLVRRSKFSSERVIPLHASTVNALQHCQDKRRCLFPLGTHLFVGAVGQPLPARSTQKIFQRLTRGITPNGERAFLRLADFRHTFASGWVSRWSRQPKPVSHHHLRLACYLGHKSFNSTWWYVTSDVSALGNAADAFRRFHARSHEKIDATR